MEKQKPHLPWFCPRNGRAVGIACDVGGRMKRAYGKRGIAWLDPDAVRKYNRENQRRWREKNRVKKRAVEKAQDEFFRGLPF